MKRLPIDVSAFSIMRSADYVYVDKTEYIYNLITKGRLYFLSRPRRFGKSLLISTLEKLLQGERDFFKGLWIDTSDYHWPSHSVIYLDFSKLNIRSPENFEASIIEALEDIAQCYGVDISTKKFLESKLDVLVQALGNVDNKIAVLVDEYDYPLVNNITDVSRAQEYQKILKGFFTTLKGLDKYLAMVFVTGVSKFAKTSVFSGMNNLNDISIDPMASALLGYTQEELEKYLGEHIQVYADANDISYTQALESIKLWYNGYRFSRDEVRVYNPFSIQYCLAKKHMENYWFKSGTPTFLVNLLQDKKVMPEEIEKIKLHSSDLEPVDIGNVRLGPLLVQTGYLTFAGYDKETKTYTLSYPNYETRESFNNYLLSMLANTEIGVIANGCLLLIKALDKIDIAGFCSVLQSIFAHITYEQLKHANESLYHALFQLLGILLGIHIESEVSTNKGRIDMVLQTKTHVFIFEIKHDISAQEALAQIQERRYYEKYQLYNKKIVLVGIAFKQEDNKLAIESAFQELECSFW